MRSLSRESTSSRIPTNFPGIFYYFPLLEEIGVFIVLAKCCGVNGSNSIMPLCGRVSVKTLRYEIWRRCLLNIVHSSVASCRSVVTWSLSDMSIDIVESFKILTFRTRETIIIVGIPLSRKTSRCWRRCFLRNYAGKCQQVKRLLESHLLTICTENP